jgi:hypothetical protein
VSVANYNSRDSSAGIEARLGLNYQGTGIRFPAGVRNFYFLHEVQTSCGVHLATYRICILEWREADHSPPSSAEVKNGGAITPLPHTSSWRGVQLIETINNVKIFYVMTENIFKTTASGER